MAEFTKERLMSLSNRENVGTICSDEIAEMARQLLASMEQEPVAYIDPFTFKNFATFRAGETDNKRMGREWVWANPDAGLIPLYAAPQLPQPAVVPQELNPRTANDVMNEHLSWKDYGDAEVFCIAWNACRAAMLQGAEPVSQPYTVPDGYALVTIDLMESLRSAAHFEKQSYAASFGSHVDTGRWKVEYEELEMVCKETDRIMAAAPQQEVHFKTTSDERLMKTPDITGETVKVIGSFNDDGFCHKHPMTAMRVHPLMQTASYPPQPVMYCPECEPRVAEWAERDKKLRNGKGV